MMKPSIENSKSKGVYDNNCSGKDINCSVSWMLEHNGRHSMNEEEPNDKIDENITQQTTIPLDLEENGGITFVHALNKRYSDDIDQNNLKVDSQYSNPDENLYVVDYVTNKTKPVKFEGHENARKYYKNLNHLKYIVLSNFKIAKAGDLTNIYFDKLISLELDNNLLDELSEVFKILEKAPILKSLNLSLNNLHSLPPPLPVNSPGFPSIIELNITYTSITEFGLEILANYMTNLEVLIYCGNQMPIKSIKFTKLRTLNLSQNKYISWNVVFYFCLYLTNLQSISLRENLLGENANKLSLITLAYYIGCRFRNEVEHENDKLSNHNIRYQDIYIDDMLDKIEKDELLSENQITKTIEKCISFYGHIIDLNLEKNEIHDWCIISNLSVVFSKLKYLKYQGNKLDVLGKPFISSQIIIAMFPNLQTLNSTPVNHMDHEEASKYFLSLFSSHHPIMSYLGEDVVSFHSKRLIQAYGEIISVGVNNYQQGQTIDARLVDVMLIPNCMAAFGIKESKKKLSLDMTVLELKILCMRLFGISTSDLRLVLTNRKTVLPVDLDIEQNSLEFYGVSDKSVIFVQIKE